MYEQRAIKNALRHRGECRSAQAAGGSQAALVVQWALLAAEEDELILMRRSAYQEPAADNSYKGLVLAKSRTVEILSRDIAEAVKKALVK